MSGNVVRNQMKTLGLFINLNPVFGAFLTRQAKNFFGSMQHLPNWRSRLVNRREFRPPSGHQK
jgi:hypothetical protein